MSDSDWAVAGLAVSLAGAGLAFLQWRFPRAPAGKLGGGEDVQRVSRFWRWRPSTWIHLEPVVCLSCGLHTLLRLPPAHEAYGVCSRCGRQVFFSTVEFPWIFMAAEDVPYGRKWRTALGTFGRLRVFEQETVTLDREALGWNQKRSGPPEDARRVTYGPVSGNGTTFASRPNAYEAQFRRAFMRGQLRNQPRRTWYWWGFFIVLELVFLLWLFGIQNWQGSVLAVLMIELLTVAWQVRRGRRLWGADFSRAVQDRGAVRFGVLRTSWAECLVLLQRNEDSDPQPWWWIRLVHVRQKGGWRVRVSTSQQQVWNGLVEATLDDVYAYADRNRWTIAKNVHPDELGHAASKGFVATGRRTRNAYATMVRKPGRASRRRP